MAPSDIADKMQRFEWETLRAVFATTPEPSEVNREAVDQLVRAELVEVQDGRPRLTANGRRVLICGSPRLWNS